MREQGKASKVVARLLVTKFRDKYFSYSHTFTDLNNFPGRFSIGEPSTSGLRRPATRSND